MFNGFLGPHYPTRDLYFDAHFRLFPAFARETWEGASPSTRVLILKDLLSYESFRESTAFSGVLASDNYRHFQRFLTPAPNLSGAAPRSTPH